MELLHKSEEEQTCGENKIFTILPTATEGPVINSIHYQTESVTVTWTPCVTGTVMNNLYIPKGIVRDCRLFPICPYN